jgi:hypothetical protein
MQGFGEFLVQQQLIDRFQLFRALQLQDKIPGARLGACAVALGYARRDVVEQLHGVFETRGGLEVMHTEPFSREPIEIIGG